MSENVDVLQPHQVLSTPLEIASTLQLLVQTRAPLTLTFPQQGKSFRTYLVQVDSDRDTLVLDEIISHEAAVFLEDGAPYRIESSHGGVLIAWECSSYVRSCAKAGLHCYQMSMPNVVMYFQRRNAFRATLRSAQRIDILLDGDKLRRSGALRGRLLEISATGCRVSFGGNLEDQLRIGCIYERMSASAPLDVNLTMLEIRHLRYEARIDRTFAGVRFHNLSGLMQRKVQSFVNQLQREARRAEKDED
ncbi:flagellar regulator YcgR PilZN domain-containing protein [Pseudomonas sp. YuFO20]|uniref:flagellar brake protein n=1 Tax=Pseudomonas sp. YuFO20 TaxID=3095362 RepID=UPI002B24615E|nr:flagellar regulator YcgR PilZN domain-containing protein [Pseudomonas sp. YuFO20]MEB2519318.1 flagellar regulator YcgR PilZN domain-containing protein [Pseudomonas sp. YuFO20]